MKLNVIPEAKKDFYALRHGPSGLKKEEFGRGKDCCNSVKKTKWKHFSLV